MMRLDRVKRVAMLLCLSSNKRAVSTLRAPLAKEKEIDKFWASHALLNTALLQPRTLWRLGEPFSQSILHVTNVQAVYAATISAREDAYTMTTADTLASSCTIDNRLQYHRDTSHSIQHNKTPAHPEPSTASARHPNTAQAPRLCWPWETPRKQKKITAPKQLHFESSTSRSGPFPIA